MKCFAYAKQHILTLFHRFASILFHQELYLLGGTATSFGDLRAAAYLEMTAQFLVQSFVEVACFNQMVERKDKSDLNIF